MPGRTLDAILLELLGLKEMTIARLLWQVEDLKAQLEAHVPQGPPESTP